MLLQFGVDRLVLHSGVFQKGPKLLQSIKLTLLKIPECLLLEVLEEIEPESSLQTVAVVSEEALQSIPVVVFGVLQRVLFELFIHFPVEIVPEEKGPEPKQSVHLLRLSHAQPLSLVEAASPVLVVALLREAVVPQQFVGRVPELGQRLRRAAVAPRDRSAFRGRGVRAAYGGRARPVLSRVQDPADVSLQRRV